MVPASSTGIGSITTDYTDKSQMRCYDINGRLVSAKEMRHGIYIVKQGNKVYKIVK